MPVLALAPEGTQITSASFTNYKLTISTSGSYYLSGDVTGKITINSGINVTLDLNGFVLSAPKGSDGGVYVKGGSFTMNGGSIAGNTASSNGGGVYNNSNSSKTMTVGGTAVINENTSNNLYLPSGKTVAVGTKTAASEGNGVAAPAAGMNIGVTTQTSPAGSSPVQFTSKGTADDVPYFTSDNANYAVQYNSAGYLELVLANEIVAPEAVSAAQYYVSLTLNDNIDINFKIEELGTGFEQSKLTVTVDGAAVGSENYTMSDETLSCVLKSVEPQSMGDSIRVVVTYDGVQVKSFEYSIRRYCESVLTSGLYDAEPELCQLCKAVLNYGKYAEDYYTGAAESTVNKGYEIDFSQISIDSKKVLDEEDTFGEDGSNVSAASRSLTLDSAFTLNFKLKYNGELPLTNKNITIKNNLDQTVDAADISVEQLTEEDYNYKISIHLGASRLSRSYTLTINNVSESKFKLTYGVYNYCSNIQSMTGEAYTDTLKTLCKAIYNYGEKAKAYTDSLSSK